MPKKPKFPPDQVIAVDLYDESHRLEETKYFSYADGKLRGWTDEQMRPLTAREIGKKGKG